MKMKTTLKLQRYIWIGILNISLCFSNIFAQQPPTKHYVGIEKNKKSFIFNEEMSIQDYCYVLEFLKQELGEDSELYKFLVPDTAKFKELYGFPFFYDEAGSYAARDSIKKLQRILPMVAISYEQAMACCQRMEYELNKHSKNKYIWQCSLPEKADYEVVFKKAEITQRESLSSLQGKYRITRYKRKDATYTIIRPKRDNRILGLTDNVAEYTQDGMIVEGDKNAVLKFVETKDSETPIGFRFKATVVSKK